MTEILIVEDDADLREILSFNLESAGYKVVAAVSAEQGLELISANTSLLLLDVMLPGMTGFQMARWLRTKTEFKTPIIFLTARGTEDDILAGFGAGADDYISKPFSTSELLARISAVLRRSGGGATTEGQLHCGALWLDSGSGSAEIAGEHLELSRKEFDILALLVRYHDSYVSRATLIEQIWKNDSYVLDRTIDVHIARIRSKLGRYHDMLKSKNRFGYYLDSHYEPEE